MASSEANRKQKRPRVSQDNTCQSNTCQPNAAVMESLAYMFELPIEDGMNEFRKLRMIHFRMKREQIEAQLAEYQAFATKARAAVQTIRDWLATGQDFYSMEELECLHNSSTLNAHFPILKAVIPERYPYLDKIDRAWLRDHLNEADAAIEKDMKELETPIKDDLEKLALCVY